VKEAYRTTRQALKEKMQRLVEEMGNLTAWSQIKM
jgi:hypothetical protein